jgi:hypothetical protein
MSCSLDSCSNFVNLLEFRTHSHGHTLTHYLLWYGLDDLVRYVLGTLLRRERWHATFLGPEGNTGCQRCQKS